MFIRIVCNKHIVPTGLRAVMMAVSYKHPVPTGLKNTSSCQYILKLTPMVRFPNHTYRLGTFSICEKTQQKSENEITLIFLQQILTNSLDLI